MVKDKNRAQKVVELYQQGYSRDAIKDMVGISQGVVSYHLTKNGYRANSKKITHGQVQDIEDCYRCGLTINQIANNFNLSKGAVRYKLRQLGYSFNTKVTEEEKKYINSLWGNGYTINEIMRKTGRSWQTVKNHIAGV